MPVGPQPPRAPARFSWRVGSGDQVAEAAAIRSAVASEVPEGASTFWSWCSSMISADSKNGAASSAKRIISTAPMAKFGATRQFERVNAPRSASRSAAARPVVPTTAVHAPSGQDREVLPHRFRHREVHDDLGTGVPHRLELAADGEAGGGPPALRRGRPRRPARGTGRPPPPRRRSRPSGPPPPAPRPVARSWPEATPRPRAGPRPSSAEQLRLVEGADGGERPEGRRGSGPRRGTRRRPSSASSWARYSSSGGTRPSASSHQPSRPIRLGVSSRPSHSEPSR